MRIVIVGGGATGALAAVHIARRFATPGAEIVVVEPGDEVGRGVAYATPDPRHLLNVRVANMSAFPEAPDHLYTWLRSHETPCARTRFCFLPRSVYGDYICDLFRTALAAGAVRVARARAVDVFEEGHAATLTLDSGETIEADQVILATGHDAKQAVNGIPADQPWTEAALQGVTPEAPLLIVGTGLTMVDMALSLDRRGHRGPLIALSRRGLLPSAHRDAIPRVLRPEEVPFGDEISQLFRWLRRLAKRYTADGANWRSAVDALRPYTQQLWRAMSPDQKRRFLRHARVYWDVHRHRMAPEIEKALAALRGSGRLQIVAGRLLAAERRGGVVVATWRARGETEDVTRAFARVIDCTGLAETPLKTGNPLLRTLLDRGALRPDPLGIGFDVAEDLRIVGADGRPSRRIRAIGPLARAAFWECIAIPDIRLQCQQLAADLAAKAG